MAENFESSLHHTPTENIEAVFNDPAVDPSGLSPNLRTSGGETVSSLLGNEEEPGVPSRSTLLPDPKTHKLSAAAYPNTYPLSPDTPEASVHHPSSDADPVPTPELKTLSSSDNNHAKKMSEPIQPTTTTHTEPTHHVSQQPSSVKSQTPSCKSSQCAVGILAWKDPIRSGAVYGTLLFALFLVKKVNFLRLSLFIFSIILGVATTAEYISKLAGFKNGILSTFRPKYNITISKARVDHLVPQIVDSLNCALTCTQKILFVENVCESATVFGAAFVLYHLTRVLSLWCIAFTVVNTAFVVTPIYFTYQDKIDAEIGRATGIVKGHTAKLHDTVTAQVSPYISKAQSASAKIPVETKEE